MAVASPSVAAHTQILVGPGLSPLEGARIDVAIDELDHSHRRVIAVAEAGLDDAGVAALTILVTRGENVEQFLDLIEVAQFADRLTAQRQSALLAERDELLDDGAQFLGLRQRRDDLLVLDERSRHVGEHRLAVFCRAVELTMNFSVTHNVVLN
mgnify:CR=1 FL=1